MSVEPFPTLSGDTVTCWHGCLLIDIHLKDPLGSVFAYDFEYSKLMAGWYTVVLLAFKIDLSFSSFAL